MKKFNLIAFFFLVFFIQKIQAQDYEFLTNDNVPDGATDILVNKDSMFFLVTYNNNVDITPSKKKSDFDIKIFNTNKYLNNIRYRYSVSPDKFFIIYNSIILNDTTIILGGTTDLLDDNGDCFIAILDACLKPKKVVIFNESENPNTIYRVSKINSQNVLLNLARIGKNSLNSFVPFNTESGLLELNKRVTIETDLGFSKVIDDKIFYFGSATRNKDFNDTDWKYLKTHMAKWDTSGRLFWEKLYVLDDNDNYYSGKDFVTFGNSNDFLAIMNDRQPNKANPLIDGGIRVNRIDSAFNIKWDKIISDTTETIGCFRIFKFNENRFLISGDYYPSNDANIFCAMIYLIDSNGIVLSSRTLKCGNPQTENFALELSKMELAPDGDMLLGGTYYDGQKYDAYLVKLKPDLRIAKQQPDNRIYYNACGQVWKDTTYELPKPKIIVLHKDTFKRTPAPLYSVGPNKSVASVEKNPSGEAIAIIYPNPTHDVLEFYSEDFSKIKEVDFKIYNSIGQLVLSKNQQPITNGKFSINVQELPTGNFHLKVSGNKNSVNFKFVVE